MRIVGGKWAGRHLTSPADRRVRPTAEHVRAELLTRLEPELRDANVLDLFAGTGALGLEALSRGAASATFVESDRDACRTIAQNLEKLGLTGARVDCADATTALRRELRTYDLVLVDPPYEQWRELEPRLGEHLARVLRPDGLLLVETGARTEPALPLALRTSRRYGSARLTLFEHP